MVKLDKIYTRGGDSGLTSLVGGKRVKKSSKIIEAIGNVDELNAILGIIINNIKVKHKVIAPPPMAHVCTLLMFFSVTTQSQ